MNGFRLFWRNDLNLFNYLNEFVDINYIDEDEFVKAGHNGLYFDQETPVRNTCHVIVLLSKLYFDSKKERAVLYSKINKLGEWLYSCEHYDGFTYTHRTTSSKDYCNGVVGPAWTIEALVNCYKVTKKDKYLERAESLILQHKFDNKTGLWTNRVEPDGKLLSMDCTFNHQLWFSASVALFLKYRENMVIFGHFHSFIEMLGRNVFLYPNGLIFHIVGGDFRIGKNIIRRALSRSYYVDMKKKEYGYHLFNLMAVVIILKNIDCVIMKNKIESIFQKSFELIKSDKFKRNLVDNKYSYQYNVSGFEGAVVCDYLGCQSLAQEYLSLQFEYCFDKESKEFSNSDDIRTLSARAYELTYLKELSVYGVNI